MTRRSARTRRPAPDLWAVLKVLPTDYTGYGGTVDREALWAANEVASDCSCGCFFAKKLSGKEQWDWVVCLSPTGPRAGLLTWEHQAGHGCFVQGEEAG